MLTRVLCGFAQAQDLAARTDLLRIGHQPLAQGTHDLEIAGEQEDVCRDPGGGIGEAGAGEAGGGDWKIALIQFVMKWDGYWGEPDGIKSPEFFNCLREFTEDMKKC